DSFEAWSVALKQVLDDSISERSTAAAAADRLRKALALDLTALIERNRRLSRERDLDRRALKGMNPRELAAAYQAHHQRVEALRALEHEADRLSLDADALEPWRELLLHLDEIIASNPGIAELDDFVATLTAEFAGKGRNVLAQLHGWRDALAAVAGRARTATAERRAAELEAERRAMVE